MFKNLDNLSGSNTDRELVPLFHRLDCKCSYSLSFTRVFQYLKVMLPCLDCLVEISRIPIGQSVHWPVRHLNTRHDVIALVLSSKGNHSKFLKSLMVSPLLFKLRELLLRFVLLDLFSPANLMGPK